MRRILSVGSALFLLSGVCHAQSSVTLYGILDSGLVIENGGPNGEAVKLGGGVSGGSRWGFQGKEDLGGGYSANFVLESGYNVNDGTLNAGGGLFGRQAWVGISGPIGSFSMGRQYSLVYLTISGLVDPFSTGSAGRANNIMLIGGARVDNSLRYHSPSWFGFSGDALYSFGGVAGDFPAGRHVEGALNYSNGPLDGRVIYSTYNNLPTATSPALVTTRTTLVAFAYDFSPMKLQLAYADNGGNPAIDSRDILVGLTFQSGASRIAASFINHADHTASDADVNQYALGYYYSLSKRTTLYAIGAYMQRRNAAAQKTFFVGNASDTGTGNRALNFGIKHSF
jgi:predicted porin